MVRTDAPWRRLQRRRVLIRRELQRTRHLRQSTTSLIRRPRYLRLGVRDRILGETRASSKQLGLLAQALAIYESTVKCEDEAGRVAPDVPASRDHHAGWKGAASCDADADADARWSRPRPQLGADRRARVALARSLARCTPGWAASAGADTGSDGALVSRPSERGAPARTGLLVTATRARSRVREQRRRRRR